MITAVNGTPSGKFLWKYVAKINHDDGGFSFSCWAGHKLESEARDIFDDIGLRIRRLLPQDAELYDSIMYKWDNSRNGGYVNATQTIGGTDYTTVGKGLYGSTLAVPAVLECDNPRSAVKLRFEDDDLFVVPRKFNVIPDIITAGGLVADPPDSVIGRPLALPSLGGLTDTWKTQFNLFLQALVFNTIHVQSPPTQGGNYKYDLWRNAFLRKVGVKKGGHVFIS